MFNLTTQKVGYSYMTCGLFCMHTPLLEKLALTLEEERHLSYKDILWKYSNISTNQVRQNETKSSAEWKNPATELNV